MNGMGSYFEAYWTNALERNPGGHRFAYAIRRRSDGRVVGTSSFYTTGAKHDGIEIGSTFLHPEVRGGAVNPEAKRLMLTHAFASGARRVQFSIDTRNARSQRAITKLGAIKEGILRQNQITWTGFVRDTAIFSILREEWPEVQARLDSRLSDDTR
jgi:RimJ/RimL family protein N-acetyltransferase